MVRRSRLDAELVRRGLARSREHAVSLIAEGRVTVAGQSASKPATGVEAGAPLVVRTDPDEPSWVSRGAHKRLGALEAFPVPVEGRRALDAGASTGGFTEVLLDRGAGLDTGGGLDGRLSGDGDPPLGDEADRVLPRPRQTATHELGVEPAATRHQS